jgi:hypothetical protein
MFGRSQNVLEELTIELGAAVEPDLLYFASCKKHVGQALVDSGDWTYVRKDAFLSVHHPLLQ